VSSLVEFGAIGVVVLLRPQAAINLQLLGAAWILQASPADAISLFWRASDERLRPRARAAGGG